MNFLFPGSFGLTEEPALPAQAPPIDGNPTPSPAGVMYSTLQQLRTHVGTEKLERTILKQLVQRLQRHFALLQPQIQLLDKSTTSKPSSLMAPGNKLRALKKRVSTEVCQIMVSEAWVGKGSNHPTSQPYFPLSSLWLQLLFEFISLWSCRCYRNKGFHLSFYICWRIWWHSTLAGLKHNPDQSAWPTEPS